jgi:predicted DNA-binding transcriptional regulator AlpA
MMIHPRHDPATGPGGRGPGGYTRPDALRPTPDAPSPDGVGRLALRLDEVAGALGVSRRTIERERAAGRFPKPDLTIGRMPLWRPETIRAWVGGGGR